MQHMQETRISARGSEYRCPPGAGDNIDRRFHSTPDPDAEPPAPNPNPDDQPPPAHAPVQEPPSTTEPPIKAWRGSK
ncbi:MAG: hypothetical protein JWR40_222 [Massilia sp.]|jgi:hypothetical protein|nr:hypothetical protein [Massilia sp.]MDB5950215.1 hypothetical protein [Massilia sp.]